MDHVGRTRKELWRSEEDEKLRKFVESKGKGNWKAAAEVVGRSANSCRLRWFNHLMPGIHRTKFSNQEQLLIVVENCQGVSARTKTCQSDQEFLNTRMKAEARKLKLHLQSEKFHRIMTKRLKEEIQAAAVTTSIVDDITLSDAPPFIDLTAEETNSGGGTVLVSSSSATSLSSVVDGPSFADPAHEMPIQPAAPTSCNVASDALPFIDLTAEETDSGGGTVLVSSSSASPSTVVHGPLQLGADVVAETNSGSCGGTALVSSSSASTSHSTVVHGQQLGPDLGVPPAGWPTFETYPDFDDDAMGLSDATMSPHVSSSIMAS